VKPTSIRTLVLSGLVAAVVTYLVVRSSYDQLPAFPRLAPLSVLLIGLLELQTSVSVRARLDGRPGTKPILPLVVARFAALAKASSLAGAVVAGGWAGILAYTLPKLGEISVASRDALTSASGVVAALVLVAGALLLERACRVRRPPDATAPRRDPQSR
jgi:hypothetical protein